MGTLTAGSIITRAARTLNDPDMVKWPEIELLEYLSDGQRAAVLVRPEVNPVTVVHHLVEGSKQQIPEDAFVLIEATRNMGRDGATPGRAITPTSRSSLDQTDPNWHCETPEAPATPADVKPVRNFVYDIRNRRTFYISPCQPAGSAYVNGEAADIVGPHQIELVHAKIPAEIAATDTVIEIDDIYQPALLAYILHRAHVKDVAVEGQSLQKSSAYFQWFMTLLLGRAEQQDADLTIRHETVEGDEGNRG